MRGQTVQEAGFTATRIWSNARAKAIGNPCAPTATDEAYFNVTTTPNAVVTGHPGDHLVFKISGWSTPVPSHWQLTVSTGWLSEFDTQPVLSTHEMSSGSSATVTVTIPASAHAGQRGSALIYSYRGSTMFTPWPVLVRVL